MTPHFKEQYTKVDDISLLAIFYFFSQANLVFISKPMFFDIWDSSSQFIYILTF